MLHILIGFENHCKDSAATSLYVGADPAAVQDAVEANLSNFGVIRLYKNIGHSKRWVGAPAETPAEETAPVFQPESETLPEEESPAEEEAPAEFSGTGRKGKK